MMQAERRLEWLQLCCDIMVALHATRNTQLAAAESYARRGKGMTSEEEITLQALYIKANLAHWRGAEAQQIKTRLATFSGDNSFEQRNYPRRIKQ